MDDDRAIGASVTTATFVDRKQTAERSECDGWLRAFLAEGLKSTIEVFKAGNAAGFTKDQLRRAKYRLGAIAMREGFAKNGQWNREGVSSGQELSHVRGAK